MEVKVVKFGGSSLSEAKQFQKVKAIIQADPSRMFVVPSAPGKRTYKDEKVTDALFRCQALAQQGQSFDEPFAYITDRYLQIQNDLGLKTDILAHLDIIHEHLLLGASADYAASRGEYLNGLLLADFLGFQFLDSAELIRFDDNGAFDSEETQRRISAIAEQRYTVIPGFYGSKPDGRIQVFPRGGSDITGAIVARGVSADIYENWTDVSGLLMADPRIVPDPKPISIVTYSELRELAYMGATVLHEDSIFPVRQACIPIHVMNTNAPEDPGTFIVPDNDTDMQVGHLTGIAGRTGFTVIAIAKDNMHNEIGFGYKVLEVLKNHNISFEHMPSGIDTLSVVIADSQLKGKRQRVLDDLIIHCNADSVEIHDNMALIATVGRGMIHSVGISARLFAALANAGVNVRMIDQGSSEMNIIVGVESDEFNDAMRAIYDAFA